MHGNAAKDIFLEALDHAPAERSRFLEQACGGNADLRRRVEKLLRDHDRAGDFLADPTGARPTIDTASRPAAELIPGEGPGSVLGRYRLIERLGEGGFGTVYLAEQQEPVVRTVALKVVKAGMDTRQIIARFEAERQALAMMDHPGIARVYDAGATEQGRPYFVMEYVRGEPITAYCERARMPIDQRLELFEQVCMAVQHAHQKGIIHRDLKPSNVLVAVVDGKPVPKVIDFGIAKAAGCELHATQITPQHQLIGTPQYMSPEQASLSGQDVDTRADVYSLGVLLYELLTGVPPFEPSRLRSASLSELERIIREEEPHKPSTRLRLLQSEAHHLAARRRLDALRLLRALSGDLDWIVMRALEKDRSRRYPTAYDLAADLQRHRSGQPVEAGPPSRRYRMGKFVRRHRLVLAMASTVFASLLAVAVFSLVFAARASRAERSASLEAERARIELAKYESLARFAQSILMAVDPKIALGSDRTLVRKILESAAARVDRELREQPEVEASIRETLGYAYFGIGDYHAAELQLSRAADLNHQHLGSAHSNTLQTEGALAACLIGASRYAEALDLLQNLIPRMARALGPLDVTTLRALGHLAFLQRELGQSAVACESYERLLAARARVSGDYAEGTLSTMNSLASVLSDLEQFDRAGDLRHRVLECQKILLGENHPHTLATLNNLANDLDHAGRVGEAEELLRHTLQVKREVLGETHPSLVTALNNLASLYSRNGRLHDAYVLLHEALVSARGGLGPEHLQTSIVLNNLSGLLGKLGRYDEAEALAGLALHSMDRHLGSGHPDTMVSALNYARVCLRAGRPQRTAAMLDRLRGQLLEWFGPLHPRTADLLAVLGEALTDLQRHREAEACLLEAHSIYRDHGTREDQQRCAKALAKLYSSMGREAGAERWSNWLEGAAEE